MRQEKAFPSRRGPANLIVPYMGGDKRYISPIMSNSESIYQFEIMLTGNRVQHLTYLEKR